MTSITCPRERPTEIAVRFVWLYSVAANSLRGSHGRRSQEQVAVVETKESQVATAASQPNKASAPRLVIRVEIIPETPPQATVPQRLNRRALALVLGVVAVLTLTWVGISVFRSDPTYAPVVSEGPGKVESQSSAPVPMANEATPVVSDEPPPKPAPSTSATESANVTTAEPRSTESKLVALEVTEGPDASPSPVNEVIPDVPQSALQTIRGTVRVSVRVIIDREGTVLAATSDDPGPSRYFERLALEAAKKWTFTPADTQEQRMMQVRFSFTRVGPAARASPPQ
jgi:TonB family protein